MISISTELIMISIINRTLYSNCALWALLKNVFKRKEAKTLHLNEDK